ncbi:MAG: hypothetical protein AAF213_01460 [Pseudomonadota bacterium]
MTRGGRLTPLLRRRALTYPYDCQYRPQIMTGGGFLKPVIADWPDQAMWPSIVAGRRATLAIGSNRSARQLARKFVGWPDPLAIPIWPVLVHDLDVHFAASIGHYGAIPATPYPWPGVRCAMMLVWLTEREFARMDETEGLGVAYDKFWLPTRVDQALPSALRASLSTVAIYRHRAGTIARPSQRSIGMAELPVRGGPGLRLDQRAMQRWLRDRLAPGLSLNGFITSNIIDPAQRHARIKQLGRLTVPPWQPSHGGLGTVAKLPAPIRLDCLLSTQGLGVMNPP